MKNILVVLFFCLLLFDINLSQQVQIKNYNELITALTNGKSVRVIIHYQKCRLLIDGTEQKSPEVIGGMDLEPFEYFAKGVVNNNKSFITSSETVLISHPRFGYVFNYVKIRIYEDNTAEIIARYLDPKSYDVVMDETFLASINDGSETGALFIYSN
jgi:hypothetical protein